MFAFILNLPYTLVGILLAIISPSTKLEFRKNPPAFIFHIKSFWWHIGFSKRARAAAFGNVIFLSPKTEDKDLEHELVHVEQHQRLPFIFPFLYYIELFRKGYRNNKYEIEAYERSGSVYKGKEPLVF